jgi:hypothetical protein
MKTLELASVPLGQGNALLSDAVSSPAYLPTHVGMKPVAAYAAGITRLAIEFRATLTIIY